MHTTMTFQEEILQGIPAQLPPKQSYDTSVSHAPKRKDILSPEEKKLAIRNALRYFPSAWHAELAEEFWEELKTYGRIYMYRFRPTYSMYALCGIFPHRPCIHSILRAEAIHINATISF